MAAGDQSGRAALDPGVIDAALRVLIDPASTVQAREAAAAVLLASHPERPHAYLVEVLAAEALAARHALTLHTTTPRRTP